MSAGALLEVRDLGVRFDLKHGSPLHAVRGVSFALDAGTRLGLVGESGSGKSTTVLALMGLLPPSATVEGEVLLDGKNILEKGEATVQQHRWVDIAVVFQGAMNAFNPVKSIGDQIVEPMRFHGVAEGKEAKTRAGELLDLVGISPTRVSSFPHELSGGMRQRAAIAMAISCKPQVLLADEPTTALDVMMQAQILELLIELTDALGLALVLVTHDLPVVAETCSMGAVMYAGRVVEYGRMERLRRHPCHPYSRLLFAATPDLSGNRTVVAIPGTPPRLDQHLAGCAFAARCDVALALCSTVEPDHELIGSHEAECHLHSQELHGEVAREDQNVSGQKGLTSL